LANARFFSPEKQLDAFATLYESVAFNHRRILYGLNYDVRDGNVRIILKTYTNNRPEICFINASTFEQVLDVLEAFLITNNKTGVDWKPDKYYKEVS
jgi:hypothetical protein